MPLRKGKSDNLKKEICTTLSNSGFRIQDKDVAFFPMLGYLPNFHLKYRVFLNNNLPGYTGPKDRAPSFVVSLDGTLPVEKQVKNGMKGVVFLDKPKGSPTKRKLGHNASQLDLLKAVTKLKNLVGATLATKPVVEKPLK